MFAEVGALMGRIGEAVATLHDGGLIHGDLTTSNMLVRHADGALVSGWGRGLAPAVLNSVMPVQSERWCLTLDGIRR